MPYERSDRGCRVVDVHQPSGAVLTATDTTAATKNPEVRAWLESRLGKEVRSRTWLSVTRVLRKTDSVG